MFDLSAVPVLETPRLRLRRFEDSDFDGLAALLSDPEVMRFIGDGTSQDRTAAWRMLAQMLGHWALRGYGLFAVEERATGRFLGRVGLIHPEGWPGLEIGWTIVRDRWGEGFATEAAVAVRDHAFERLNIPRLISLIHPDNTASVQVAVKTGERPDRVIELMGKTAVVYAIDNPRRG
jgi:RimJ/RimL family protein N-acetyltransferase